MKTENNPELITIMSEELEESVEEEKEIDPLCCPIKGCVRHTMPYKTANGLKRHMESAHPDYIK